LWSRGLGVRRGFLGDGQGVSMELCVLLKEEDGEDMAGLWWGGKA